MKAPCSTRRRSRVSTNTVASQSIEGGPFRRHSPSEIVRYLSSSLCCSRRLCVLLGGSSLSSLLRTLLSLSLSLSLSSLLRALLSLSLSLFPLFSLLLCQSIRGGPFRRRSFEIVCLSPSLCLLSFSPLSSARCSRVSLRSTREERPIKV